MKIFFCTLSFTLIVNISYAAKRKNQEQSHIIKSSIFSSHATISTTTEVNSSTSSLAPFHPVIRPRLNTSILRPLPSTYRINEPADLLDIIPIVKDINRLIPRRFSLANHNFVLNENEMVIRHQYLDIKASRSQKNSWIVFTYDESGQNFDTSLEVPLFYSSGDGFSDFSLRSWSAYPLGNYTMRIRRDNGTFTDLFYIKAQTKF